MTDRPMQDPARHFAKLAIYRSKIEELADRYPSKGAEYEALAEAAHALDRAVVYFTGDPLWFAQVSPWGGRMPHTGCIPPLTSPERPAAAR